MQISCSLREERRHHLGRVHDVRPEHKVRGDIRRRVTSQCFHSARARAVPKQSLKRGTRGTEIAGGGPCQGQKVRKRVPGRELVEMI